MKRLRTAISVTAVLIMSGCATYSPEPGATAHLRGVTQPGQSTMYAAEQCVGSVDSGVCHGEIFGEPIGYCQLSPLNGRCLGTRLSSHN
jgi:hypothetical protein